MSSTSETQVSLKLLIDKKGQRILYGEADKNFVDFLFTILSLPVGSVIRLLSPERMVGPLGKLYCSIDSLNADYFEPNQNKDNLLKPVTLPTTQSQGGNLLQLQSPSSTSSGYFRCSSKHSYFTATYGVRCPACLQSMCSAASYISGAGDAKATGGGYVKGLVTYMVMDDLTVKPMSTKSAISVLNEFNIEDVGLIEEKLVYLDMQEGLKLLRASLHSPTVLTDVFLHKIGFSKHDGAPAN